MDKNDVELGSQATINLKVEFKKSIEEQRALGRPAAGDLVQPSLVLANYFATDSAGPERVESITAETLDPRKEVPASASGSLKTPLKLGRFKLGPELGCGGMGKVLQAWDPELGRNVAVKLLLNPSKIRPDRLARFINEARITSQLQHPNIVPVYDMGANEDGQVFFVMKKVEGRTLESILNLLAVGDEAATVEWSPHRLLSIFVQVCNAVAYAHERGVLHRDIKPANIMVGAFGEVLVLDWGLLEVQDQEEILPEATERVNSARNPGSGTHDRIKTDSTFKTREGLIFGTPGYMSPEQARGELGDLDGRSDIWSLGAVLFELLTFSYAISAELRQWLGYRDGSYPSPDPRKHSYFSKISDEIAEICLKAMEPGREERYETVTELAREVEQFLEGSKRREQALELVERAKEYRLKIAQAGGRVAELKAEAEALLAGVASNAPEEQKIAGWDKDAEAVRLADGAGRDEILFVQSAQSALERFSGLEEAHALLADYYQEKHQAAEQADDNHAAVRFELLLRAHDQGKYADYLRGEGTLDLVTDPPGAEVELLRYEEHRRRLVPTPVDAPGKTPLLKITLPMGSYLLKLRAEGCVPVRYPLVIRRQGHWDGVRPGSDKEAPFTIRLPRTGELGDDDLYIPGGWFASGGDPLAAGSLPGKDVWVDAMAVQRFPVTHGEYLEYLNDLVDKGRSDEVQERVPRETAAAEGELGAELYDRGPDGRFTLRPADAGGMWTPDHPVCNVDWACADAYASWWAEKTGRPWRLPCELEWEKAARGVDRRPLPWGSYHDHSWCVTVESHAEAPLPSPVDSNPVDESPYGVRGLGGGVRDWVLDEFIPTGPPVEASGLLVVQPPREDAPTHGTRGGAWCLPDWVSRIACRGYHPPIRLGDLSFRLICPLND